MKWNKVLEKFFKGLLATAGLAAIGVVLNGLSVGAPSLLADLGLTGTIWSGVILGLIASANNWWKHRKDGV